MIFERLDDLLNEVDEWKLRLHEKLKAMTPEQRAKFWKEANKRSRGFLRSPPTKKKLASARSKK